ncbi:MAG: hypothetical protein QOD83_5055 [Solirubrobacteraceae bacterium]|nr:hypothetical protein [Solirubrobacteraceae bacterium]
MVAVNTPCQIQTKRALPHGSQQAGTRAERACGTPDPSSGRRSRGGGEAVSQGNLNRQHLRPLSDPTVGGSRGGVPL